MKIDIVSHGGIGSVDGVSLTGSCHEMTVRYENSVFKILVDAGMFQGTRIPDRDTPSILRQATATFLTHPHADHIGDVPMVFMGGEPLSTPIFATTGTKRAAGVSWEDSAKIFAEIWDMRLRRSEAVIKEVATALDFIRKREDGEKQVIRTALGDRVHQSDELAPSQRYDRALKMLKRYGVDKDDPKWRDQFAPKKPPYDAEAAKKAFEYVTPFEIADGWKEVVPGKISARLHDAGHIVGSTSVLLKIEGEKGEKPKHVLFSGDIGSYKWDFHPCGVPLPPSDVPLDVVVIESTYGKTVRAPFEKGRAEFEETFEKHCKYHDNVVLSCFSLDRFQNVLFRAVTMKLEGKTDLPIYADSPSAISHIKSYVRSAKERLKTLSVPEADAIRHTLGEGYLERERDYLTKFVECLDPANGHYQTVEDEPMREFCKSDVSGKKIIVTTSGMANGGPVMGYLKSWLSNPKAAFFFPGYMAVGTTGRTIVDIVNESDKANIVPEGERFVKVEEASLLVRATIENPRFLSGHADAEDILTYLESLQLAKGQKILIIHGETDGSSIDLKEFLESYGYHPESLIIPELSQTITFEEGSVSRFIPLEKRGPDGKKALGRTKKRPLDFKKTSGASKEGSGSGATNGGGEGAKNHLEAIKKSEQIARIAQDSEILASIRTNTFAMLQEYEGALLAISNEAFEGADSEYVRKLLEGLKLQSELEELKTARTKLENQRELAKRALERAKERSAEAKTPDRRKRQRLKNAQEKSGENISEYSDVLSVLEGQIRSVDHEIVKKERLVREAFEGFSTSQEIAAFAKNGTKPVIEGTDGIGSERAAKFKKRLENERGRVRDILTSVEDSIEDSKERAKKVRDESNALKQQLERVETILSHLPEHIAAVAKSIRKQVMRRSTAPKDLKGEELTKWERSPERKAMLDEMRSLAETLERKAEKREMLLGVLGAMGVVRSKNDLQTYRTDSGRISRKIRDSEAELDRLERNLRDLRSDREIVSKRLSEIEERLLLPMQDADFEIADETVPSVAPLMVMGGIRMAVEDILSELPERASVERVMAETKRYFHEAETLSPGQDSARIAEIQTVIESLRLEKNEEVLESLRLKALGILRT
jgi:metallo-beta-lactamase family protein